MFIRTIARRGLVLAAGLTVALFAAAVPALASGGPSSGNQPVTANAAIASTITLSGLSPTITLAGGQAGGTATSATAENYTVSTSDPSGYTLSVTPAAASFTSNGPGSPIADSGLTITEKALYNGPSSITFSGTATEEIDSEAAAGTNTYMESWALGIPAGTPAGVTYSDSFDYLALGS